MREPLTYEDVEELEAVSTTAQQHVDAAGELARAARETHPDDELSPADLLVAAAFHLREVGDAEQEITTLQAAVDADGDAAPDTRVWLHGALLHAGRLEQADELATEIRRSRTSDPDVYDVVGGAYEDVGDLETAHRWLTMGLTRLSRREPGTVSEEALTRLTLSRSRVRQELGHPPDAVDELARREMEAHALRLKAMGDGPDQ